MTLLVFVFNVVKAYVSSGFFTSHFFIVFAFGILILIINIIRRIISGV